MRTRHDKKSPIQQLQHSPSGHRRATKADVDVEEQPRRFGFDPDLPRAAGLKRFAGMLNGDSRDGWSVIHLVQEDHAHARTAFSRPSHPLAGLHRRRLSGREAARRLRISAATGVRLAGKVRRGESLAPAKCGRPPGWGKLGPYRAFLLELVGQDPDITLFELQGALAEAEGVSVHPSAIARTLKKLGFTYKKSRWSRTSGDVPASRRRVPIG